MNEHTKALDYAYPSSTIAKRQSFSKSGCWFVTTGDPEGDYDTRKVVYASASKDEAIAAFSGIEMPISNYSQHK